MMAGIVVLRSNPKAFNLGFPGRSEPGVWRLEHEPKGFAGSHGSRHIYNMNGGKVYEVDFLFMERVSEQEPTPNNCLQLRLPSLVDARETLLYVPEKDKNSLHRLWITFHGPHFHGLSIEAFVICWLRSPNLSWTDIATC
jgi:hypothetical protein